MKNNSRSGETAAPAERRTQVKIRLMPLMAGFAGLIGILALASPDRIDGMQADTSSPVFILSVIASFIGAAIAVMAVMRRLFVPEWNRLNHQYR